MDGLRHRSDRPSSPRCASSLDSIFRPRRARWRYSSSIAQRSPSANGPFRVAAQLRRSVGWHPCCRGSHWMATDYRAVEVPWHTLFKIIGAVALVWIWLQLWQLFLLLVVAILLAVALDPVVRRVQRAGLPRWAASTIVGFLLLGVIVAFLAGTWSSLSSGARLLGTRVAVVERDVIRALPPILRDAFNIQMTDSAIQSYLAPVGERLVRALTFALFIVAMAFILTIYLLIEGHKTHAWLRAFVPMRLRGKADQTVAELRRVISAYVAGNVVTSIFAAVFVFVTLSALRVPAALLLALLAGVCDFVPVL